MGRSGDRVAVVGAGITGVVSAALLARQGHQVTLIDQAPELGGLLGSVRHGDHWFDHGTHVPQELGHDDLDELLFGDLDPAAWRPSRSCGPATSSGRPRPGHPFPLARHAWAGAPTTGRWPSSSRMAPGSGHPSSTEELHATFGPTITDQVFRPAVQRFFGRQLDDLAPGAHRVLFNRVTALDGPTTTALKAALPHLDATLAFHRPEDGPNRAAWYPTAGGCGAWVDHLAARHLGPVDVRLGHGVEKVASETTPCRSLLLDDGTELEVDRLVWTLPPSRFLAAAGIDLPHGAVARSSSRSRCTTWCSTVRWPPTPTT